jgi:hypothetical protein
MLSSQVQLEKVETGIYDIKLADTNERVFELFSRRRSARPQTTWRAQIQGVGSESGGSQPLHESPCPRRDPDSDPGGPGV